jgi:putative transposase
MQALLAAIHKHPPPLILHSDHGSEYCSKDYMTIVRNLEISISMSKKGAPWENGYQESFYSQFKVDLGDSNRFQSLGELVYAVYETIHSYNRKRIHSKLKMPPAVFAERHLERSKQLVEAVS